MIGLTTKMLRASAGAGHPVYVNHITVKDGNQLESRTVNFPTHEAGDWLIAVTGDKGSFTADAPIPDLLSGFTQIRSGRGGNPNLDSRSIRIQYEVASGSQRQISWLGAYGYVIVLREVGSLLQSDRLFVNGVADRYVSIPNLSGLKMRSLLLCGSFAGQKFTNNPGSFSGISGSEFTLKDKVFGLAENIGFTSFSGVKMDTGDGNELAQVAYSIEFGA